MRDFCAVKYRNKHDIVSGAAIEGVEDGGKELSSQHVEAGLHIRVTVAEDIYTVSVDADPSRTTLRLHWAINEWESVPEAFWPPGTVRIDHKAVQTPFVNGRVEISFPESECPNKVVFVLNEGHEWINNGASDFVAYLKPPGVDDIISKVIAAETEYERWSLFNRTTMATSIVDAAVAAGPKGMGFLLAWLRLSSMRQLPWYKGSNYQSKDAAHAQKVLAQKMADTIRTAEDPLCRLFARLSLSLLPRGGGNGDDIRMGILHIMRQHGIREGHRPGIEDRFLESWHQKLHTNTTPEDIPICEAYLAFLKSGDMGEFWRVAWENGRITPESLQSMDHPIDPSPFHLPQIIDSMEHYLWILKQTHSGADLDVAYEMVRGSLDGDLSWMIGDILANRNEWWVPGKIVEARQRLSEYWKNTDGVSRDVLLLDIALDSYFRVLIERVDKASLPADDVINLISLVLDNASIAEESVYLNNASAFWHRLMDNGDRWSGQDWARRALAGADTASVALEDYADMVASFVQPAALLFGEKCDIEASYILNFSEEVVRGQSVTLLGQLFQVIGPYLREAAGVGAWEVVSCGSEEFAIGKLEVMSDIEGIQGVHIPDPTVIIADRLSGNEDIPENVRGIITASPTDVLSHVAIRARAQGVLLATCFDIDHLEFLKQLETESCVRVSISPSGDVVVDSDNGASNIPDGLAKSKTSVAKKQAAQGRNLDSNSIWVLSEDEFTGELVGGKALNLKKLHAMAGEQEGLSEAEISVPASISLPFGTFEKVIKDPKNKKVRDKIKALRGKLDSFSSSKQQDSAGVPKELTELRAIISGELVPPQALTEAIIQKANIAGLSLSPDEEENASLESWWPDLWNAICHVWASTWNDRAWLSRRAIGLPDDDLYMSVLLQQIIPARYAFVLHTADPISGENGHVHGELVMGMGETLVGNFAGRALSFSSSPSLSGTITEPNIKCYPSKIKGLFVSRPTLIARSDSNGEDLEDFAGAGLYSSVPVFPYSSFPTSYASEELIWDHTIRSSLLTSISTIGQQIETACGSPQDIEGVIDQKGHIYIVQTRAQVIDE